MFKQLKRLFGFKEPQRSLEDKLLINIFLARGARDYFKWMDYK